ncbi:hypothetical protein [Amycolatopsis sp. NPDC059657]|uniref:hypothetical protein n=1 Tax=Amycolatopsis sp. NPDC059657 TaxID=3346899 RepID=UPI00366E2F72
MTYQTRSYDIEHNDGFGPDPVVVLVVTGTHDVSRLIHLFARTGNCEQVGVSQQIQAQVRRHNGGKAAMRLLAEHGGPDLLKHVMLPTKEAVRDLATLLDEADSQVDNSIEQRSGPYFLHLARVVLEGGARRG